MYRRGNPNNKRYLQKMNWLWRLEERAENFFLFKEQMCFIIYRKVTISTALGGRQTNLWRLKFFIWQPFTLLTNSKSIQKITNCLSGEKVKTHAFGLGFSFWRSALTNVYSETVDFIFSSFWLSCTCLCTSLLLLSKDQYLKHVNIKPSSLIQYPKHQKISIH